MPGDTRPPFVVVLLHSRTRKNKIIDGYNNQHLNLNFLLRNNCFFKRISDAFYNTQLISNSYEAGLRK